MDGKDVDGPVYGGRRARPGTATRPDRRAPRSAPPPVVQPAVRYVPAGAHPPVVGPPSAASVPVPVPAPVDDELDEATTPRRAVLPVLHRVEAAEAAEAAEAIVVPPAGPGATASAVSRPAAETTGGTAPRASAASASTAGAAPSVDWSAWAQGSGSGRARVVAAAVRFAPIVLAVVSLTLCLSGSWVAPFSSPERQLVFAATQDADGFGTIVLGGDADRALWLVLLRGWIAVVGPSEFALRFLTAVLAGLATAAVTVLGRRLASPLAGVFAGATFALLPRVAFHGAEISGAALALACSTWAAVALVTAVQADDPVPSFRVERSLIAPADRRRRRRAVAHGLLRWATAAVLLALAIGAAAPSAALLVVLPLALLLGDGEHLALRRTLATVGAAALLASPLAVAFGTGAARFDRGGADDRGWFDVALSPVSSATSGTGVVLALLVVAGLVLAIVLRERTGAAVGTRALWLGGLWVVVPGVLAIVLAAAVGPPTGILAFTLIAPGLSLVAGSTLAALPSRLAWCLLAVYAACALADVAAVRLPYLVALGDALPALLPLGPASPSHA